MQRRFVCALAVLLLAPAMSPVRAADKVDLKNLLPQMTDLSLLAEYPDPPYVARQFSSYDRASEAPGLESWFANGDRGFMLYDGVLKEETPYFKHGPKQAKPDGHFAAGYARGNFPNAQAGRWVCLGLRDGPGRDVPKEAKIPQGYIARSAIAMDPQGHVLAEMDGPGCVVNIWSANPKDGRQNPHLSRRGRETGDRGVTGSDCWEASGRRRSTARKPFLFPIRSPANDPAVSTFIFRSPMPGTARSRSTDRTSIITSTTAPTRRGRKSRLSSSKIWSRLSQEVQGVIEGLRLKHHRTPGEKKLFYTDVQSLGPGESARLTFEGPQAIKFFSAKLQGDQRASTRRGVAQHAPDDHF